MSVIRAANIDEDPARAKEQLAVAVALAEQIRPTTRVLTIRQATCKDQPEDVSKGYFPCPDEACPFSTKYLSVFYTHLERTKRV